MSENAPQPSIHERLMATLSEGPETAPPAPESPSQPATRSAAPVDVDEDERPEPAAAPEPEDAETEKPEPAEAAEPEIEEIEIGESLNDLATYLEIDPSDLYGLQVNVDVDGQSKAVTLSEIKDAYAEAQRVQGERQRLAEARQNADRERQQIQQQVQAQLAQLAAVLDSAENLYNSDINSADLAELQQTDPGEAALRRQMLMERRRQLDEAKAKGMQAIQQWQAEQAEQWQKQHREVLEKEGQALRRAIPEWSDPAKYRQGAEEIGNYLKSAGFDPQEVAQVADHRLIVMARKAMLYDSREKTADATKKRVVKLAKKTPKPGNTESKAMAQQEQQSAVRRRLRKTGKLADAQELIKGLL